VRDRAVDRDESGWHPVKNAKTPLKTRFNKKL
jgi:hypothetical protein